MKGDDIRVFEELVMSVLRSGTLEDAKARAQESLAELIKGGTSTFKLVSDDYYVKFGGLIAAQFLAVALLQSVNELLEEPLYNDARSLFRRTLESLDLELTDLGYEAEPEAIEMQWLDRLQLAGKLLAEPEPRVAGESWEGRDDQAKRLAATMVRSVLRELKEDM